MGRVEQDHVLHVLVDVPWVRLDEELLAMTLQILSFLVAALA